MQTNSRPSLIVTLSLSLGLGLTTVQAAPLISRQDSSGDILEQCSDITFSNGWLVGTCSADNGTSITSSVWLSSLIGTTGDDLQWEIKGDYYSSCVNGAAGFLTNSTLNSQCEVDGPYITIDLAEHVSVYNGYLLSDLAGTPTGPTVTSNISVPDTTSELEYKVYLFNQGLAHFCQEFGTEDAAFGIEVFSSGPQDCYSVPLSEWQTANGWYPEAPPFISVLDYQNYGWQIEAYATDACLGEPVATFGYGSTYNDVGCLNLSGLAVGFKISPMWNSFWL